MSLESLPAHAVLFPSPLKVSFLIHHLCIYLISGKHIREDQDWQSLSIFCFFYLKIVKPSWKSIVRIWKPTDVSGYTHPLTGE